MRLLGSWGSALFALVASLLRRSSQTAIAMARSASAVCIRTPLIALD